MAETILDRVKRTLAPFVHQVLVYDADPPTIEDGDVRPAQMGPAGGLLVEIVGAAVNVALGAVAQGDPTATPATKAWFVKLVNAAGTVLDLGATLTGGTQRSNPSPSTPSSSSAYEQGRVLKASAGTFRSLYVELNPALGDGTYYVQLLTASAALPADGAVTHLRPPQALVHVSGQAESANFYEGDGGISFAVGCTACVSSTQFAKTEVANAALFAGSVL